jgi:hypothetical protein
LRAWGVKLALRNGARKLAIIMNRMWIEGKDFRFGQPPSAKVTHALQQDEEEASLSALVELRLPGFALL